MVGPAGEAQVSTANVEVYFSLELRCQGVQLSCESSANVPWWPLHAALSFSQCRATDERGVRQRTSMNARPKQFRTHSRKHLSDDIAGTVDARDISFAPEIMRIFAA